MPDAGVHRRCWSPGAARHMPCGRVVWHGAAAPGGHRTSGRPSRTRQNCRLHCSPSRNFSVKAAPVGVGPLRPCDVGGPAATGLLQPTTTELWKRRDTVPGPRVCRVPVGLISCRGAVGLL